ncbi:hypothetical protein E4T38_04942 [Aureobasidium subglaciale]|nr:hypothetical protein E4T38_04942 [Aureobasidium subglaciale]KAI5222287.1 hypothetical protein E4T40_04980 [Aureobasidium subglaciale]KAI5226265.1 hypothetical protein E4T41_04799 [Aureobasidium subglaciale]KAI5262051.1 hypothetical protein E4T46_04692 [Aureobasidium subglaciale]
MMTDVSQSSGPSLDDMPPEILHIIYLYVYPDDIKALGCTSRQLQLVSAEYPTDEVYRYTTLSPSILLLILLALSRSPIGAGRWISQLFKKDVLRGINVLTSMCGTRKTVLETRTRL